MTTKEITIDQARSICVNQTVLDLQISWGRWVYEPVQHYGRMYKVDINGIGEEILSEKDLDLLNDRAKVAGERFRKESERKRQTRQDYYNEKRN